MDDIEPVDRDEIWETWQWRLAMSLAIIGWAVLLFVRT